jgi:hypothetical protein
MQTTTVRLNKITLNLARCKEFPDGSIRHGYEFFAPLDENAHIDPEAWKLQRTACIVRRFWADEPPMRGVLVHRAGGAGGASWGFDYDVTINSDDEAGFHFADHAFIAGEYVSIRDAERKTHTFKIISVK